MPSEISPLQPQPELLRASPHSFGPSPWAISNGLASRADGTSNMGSDSIRLCILGEPASKANSRQIVMLGKRMAVIKSKKAREYEAVAIRQAQLQCKAAGWKCRAIGKMRVMMTIYYASERPDLDESVVLDVLQMSVYGNDRQVREKHVYHAIDKANPRTEIIVEALP